MGLERGFANQSYQGCYNAALVHLVAGAEAENDKKYLRNQMMDYGWEGKEDTTTLPPIWISAIGTNGLLIPIRYFSPKEYGDGLLDKKDPIEFVFARDRHSKSLDFGRISFPNMCLLLFFVILAGNSYFFFRACGYVAKSRWGNQPGDRCCHYKQRIDFGVVCLAQILLSGQLGLLAWIPLRTGVFHLDSASGWATLTVLFASTAVVIVTWLAFASAYRREMSGWNPRRLAQN